MVDFELYHPSYNAQASFIASPIYDGDEKIGVLLFRMPVDPLRAMTEAVSQIAEGTITSGTRIESHSRDEVGVLSHGFNLITNHLAGLVQQVQKAGIQVTTSATRLDAAGKELESMMTEQVASTLRHSSVPQSPSRPQWRVGLESNP